VPVPASKNAHDLAAIVMLDDASKAVPAEADVYGYGNKKAERLDEQIAKLIICG
jgi:hypothetical protein